MSAAVQHDAALAGSGGKRQKNCLQHEVYRSGAASGSGSCHVERKVSCFDRLARRKFQLLRTECITCHLGLTKRCRCPNRRQMLSGEARVPAGRTHVTDLHITAGDHRQAQCSAENLSAAFAMSAVDDQRSNHRPYHRCRRARCLSN